MSFTNKQEFGFDDMSYAYAPLYMTPPLPSQKEIQNDIIKNLNAATGPASGAALGPAPAPDTQNDNIKTLMYENSMLKNYMLNMERNHNMVMLFLIFVVVVSFVYSFSYNQGYNNAVQAINKVSKAETL